MSINKWQLCLLLALIPQSSLHHLQLSKQAGFQLFETQITVWELSQKGSYSTMGGKLLDIEP